MLFQLVNEASSAARRTWCRAVDLVRRLLDAPTREPAAEGDPLVIDVFDAFVAARAAAGERAPGTLASYRTSRGHIARMFAGLHASMIDAERVDDAQRLLRQGFGDKAPGRRSARTEQRPQPALRAPLPRIATSGLEPETYGL